MELSRRLRAVASYVDKGAIVYDVGSDHALIPCYLVANGICEKVYAGDNKEGPLDNASANIERYGLKDKVIPVLADGLSDVAEDVDTVIVSGMGVNTAIAIFEGEELSRFKKIIVQVNKDTDQLRQYISDHHYTILDECVVLDDFFYEIVVFNTKEHPEYDKLQINYGPFNLIRDDRVFRAYLSDKYAKLNEIFLMSFRKDIREKLEEIESLDII